MNLTNLGKIIILSMVCLLSFTNVVAQETHVQLIERIISCEGYMTIFEHDNQNRISRVVSQRPDGVIFETYTVAYEDNNAITVVFNNHGLSNISTFEYVRDGNIVTVKRDGVPESTLRLNEEGLIISRNEDETNISYLNGNIVRMGEQIYLHDDKNSPFLNSNTPQWILDLVYDLNGFHLKNNVIEIEYDGQVVFRINYDYDRNGFPTRSTNNFDESLVFEYIFEIAN